MTAGAHPLDNRALLDAAEAELQRLRGAGAGVAEMLAALAATADEISGADTTASILLLDQQGLLRNGASPGLPPDYLQAIDGLRPDPQVGTCAAAAATGDVVLTPDFMADTKWAELRHLPMALGYRSAWSVPIKGRAGQVLGTFGTYCRLKRQPSAKELEALQCLSAMAAAVLTPARDTSAEPQAA